MNTTYVKKIDDGYLVIDFDIVSVLEKLRLIRNSKIAKNINLFVYGFMGFSLLIFALALGFYSIIIFLNTLLHLDMFNLEVIFKSIIALTLGLAIFDLAKTILEHEIFFRNIIRDEHDSNEILSKFLISIIIALSIESLMVVFKIALSDYTGMIHAFYLILGVSLLIYTLGKYNSFTSKSR
jgi:predicted membrane channel-forming protein YqfA (hemolysin III family)